MMVIYKIIDLTSSKIYIGSAIDFKERKRIHLRDLNKNNHHSKYLQRRWNKYGEENFCFEIVEKINTKEDLIIREQYWLDFYRPFGRNGYNSCKIANSMLGFKHSNKTKELLSKIQSSKISQYSTEGNFIKEWESIKEAAAFYNVVTNTISNTVNKNKKGVGFLWKRFETTPPNTVTPYKREKNKTSVIAKETYLKNQKAASKALIKNFSFFKDNTQMFAFGTKELFNTLEITRNSYYKNKNKFNNLFQIKQINASI
jgi:hypothetical protein